MGNGDSRDVTFGRVAAVLPVTDMARSLAFYADALGFKTVFLNGDPAQYAVLRRGEAEFHLTLRPDHTPTACTIAHMLVGDARAVHDLCLSYGLAIPTPLQDMEFGLRSFVFEDPDGNRIDVGQPA